MLVILLARLLVVVDQLHDCGDVLFGFGNGVLLTRELGVQLGDGCLKNGGVQRVVCHVLLLVLCALALLLT